MREHREEFIFVAVGRLQLLLDPGAHRHLGVQGAVRGL